MKSKCVCGKEAVKRYGFCRGCLKIKNEIEKDKEGDKDTCKDCMWYRRIDQIGKFKCAVNNNVYSKPNACFMFKKAETRRKD
jgi:hypothetical protein